MSAQRILFIASEAAPLIKVGGLADVVGALPSALMELGDEVRILIPKYGAIDTRLLTDLKQVGNLAVPWQGQLVSVSLELSRLPGTAVPLYLLDAPGMFVGNAIYYEHGGPGGMRLAQERYLFFSWAASHAWSQLGWSPTVLHCHDWHTAAIPALLSLVPPAAPPTVLTIHNLEGQGKWSAAEVFSWLGLAGNETASLKYRDGSGDLNLLQLGIRNAAAVNTVSPNYAQEILTPEYGAGLSADCAARPGGVTGILNGIDVRSFDPSSDIRISARYSSDTAAVGKLANKRALLSELGLPLADGPLFGLIGRLTSQKGVDLLPASVPAIVQAGGQLVVLGSGVPEIEQLTIAAIKPYARHCRVIVKFDARLARCIYAASDFFLMPSRFEPCGLGQMVAMRYGTLPIVRDTGGLHDTVRDLRKYRAGTGLVFGPATATALTATVRDALRIYRQPDTMNSARQRAMSGDFSWRRSARAYQRLYDHVAHPH